MRTTETFYAVELPCHLGKAPRLATGGSAGPGLHYWRKKAIEFKNGLVEVGFKKARVVKVRVTYHWILLSAFCLLHSAIASSPTQGAAAADLVRKVAHRSASAPLAIGTLQSAMPPAVPQFAPRLVASVSTQTWYFAATAVATNGLESDYSSEVSFSTTNRHVAVTLAWDPSPGTNTGLRYNIYTGGASRTYTNTASAGTNLTLMVALYPPPLTNTLLTVTGTLGATNLAWASSLRGPWMLLGTTNYTGTNVPSPRFYRGVGKQGNKVTIKSTRF